MHPRSNMYVPGVIASTMPALTALQYNTCCSISVQLVLLPPEAADVTPQTPAQQVGCASVLRVLVCWHETEWWLGHAWLQGGIVGDAQKFGRVHQQFTPGAIDPCCSFVACATVRLALASTSPIMLLHEHGVW